MIAMRTFSARETEWLQELDGIELAGFWRRAIAFVIDWTLVSIVLSLVAVAGFLGYLKLREMHGHPMPNRINFNMKPEHFEFNSDDSELEKKFDNEATHIVMDILVPVLYFGLFTWRGKGRTPGKRLMRIRVVSLVHRHLTFWHSIERALGYGAAALEGGFGFVQYFIHPYRRCAQDRLAETIVVTELSYKALQSRTLHALLPDAGNLAETHRADESLAPEA
jgi:uncharacterized RDD family membrane protein YckC